MSDHEELRAHAEMRAAEAEHDEVAEAKRPTMGVGQSVPPSAAYLRAEAAKLLELAGERDRAEAAALLAAREAARPKMPELGEAGAIVTFARYQSGREYHYAAIGWREGRSVRWAVTGSETRRLNWPGLLEFIGEANWPTLHVVSSVTRIGPDPEHEAPVAEVMGRYGRVERTEQLGAQADPLHGLPGFMVIGVQEPRTTGRSRYDEQNRW